jgi:hypothetical protein
MMRIRLRKNILSIVIFLFILNIGDSYGQKISIGAGVYSIDATVGDSRTNVFNAGAYRFQFHSKIHDQVELLLGYNIIIENIYRGDKAFGPFIGFSYYPFQTKTISQTTVSNLSILHIKKFNPYVYAGFNQRQYQSVKASYSGFSFGSGVEIGWKKNISLFGDIQYATLDGPSEGEVKELIAITGIVYNY